MADRRYLVTLLTVTGLTAAGCASAPPDVPDLDAARSALNAVEQDPLAQSAAAVTLQHGQLALDSGQSALARHQPLEIVEHFAYLARRDAETARAQIDEARARAQIEHATAERNQIMADAQARRAEHARLRAQLAEQQVQSAQVRALTAEQQAQEARLGMQMQQMQTDEARQRAQALEQQMAELKARPTERGYVLSLGDVLFDSGQATLKLGAQVALGRLADFMRNHPEQRVEVDGNTDSIGSPAFNEELSLARADAVRAALLTAGVSPDRIVTRGFGPSMPVATNATSAGRQQNRRVDVVFLNTSGNAGADSNLRLGESR